VFFWHVSNKMTIIIEGKTRVHDIVRINEMLHGKYDDDVGSCFHSESTLGRFAPPCFDVLSRADRFRLAVRDGLVVGCVAMNRVSIYPIVKTPCPPGTMLVHSLCTHRDVRGQYIGTALLKDVLAGVEHACLTIHREAISRGKHADEVLHRYPKLVKLYTKHGFVRAGFDQCYDVWVRHRIVAYSKHPFALD